LRKTPSASFRVPTGSLRLGSLIAAALLAAGVIAPIAGAPRPAAASASRTQAPVPNKAKAATLAERPLADLSADAASFIAGRDGLVGVAVLVPGQGTIYSLNAEEPFALASVAKLQIMLTLLDQAARDERALTDDEVWLLELMITVSDNDAASELWLEVGGGEAVAGYSHSAGDLSFQPGSEDEWGTSTDTPASFAQLLLRLFDGDILDPAGRGIALDLLARVTSDQRWGVTAGLDPESDLVFLKNGWYVEEDEDSYSGWRVNSAGIVVRGGGAPYVIVVFTDFQPDQDYGKETVEGIASLINTALTQQTPVQASAR
jgi:beta-lactamase class A